MKRLACIVLGTVACAAPPEPGVSPNAIDLSTARLIDLSYAYDQDTLYWPTSPSSFELTELANGPAEGGYFYSAYSFCTPEHGGTHLDAPVHFAEGGLKAGEISLQRLIAPGIVIDMSAATVGNPDARLDLDTVKMWEAQHGAVPEGAIVILRTGWGIRWPDAMAYLGDDKEGDASNLHFPAYGEQAARYLIEQRRVGAIGVDTASIDYGQTQDFIVHRIAAGAGVPGLENVARVDQLPEQGFWVLALPVKIARGSGGPVRIVAVVPERGPGS